MIVTILLKLDTNDVALTQSGIKLEILTYFFKS